MSIALHSACLAAEHYLRGESVGTFQRRLALDVVRQVRRATLLSHLLVRGSPQAILSGGARMAPSMLTAVASLTRMPAPVLGGAGRQARPA